MLGWADQGRERDQQQVIADELAELDRLPPYVTRKEAGEFLRITLRAVDNLLERGDLSRRRVGGRTVIPRACIRALIVRQIGGDLVDDLELELGRVRIAEGDPE